MHYCYIKRVGSQKTSFFEPKTASLALTGVGLFLLVFAALPIFFYQFFVTPKFTKMVKPIPDEAVLGEKTTGGIDFTKVSNWFVNAPKLPPLPSKITHYSLSIPKLKIVNATVKIGGDDLKESLLQYEGTAFPGQFGNSVIFGHSVLPQFFNPKNYLTIFSTLPTLKTGDAILLDFDGVGYRYVVEQMIEVKPDDISILEQKYDDAYITLITCVPPGTYLRRLAVRARLGPI